MAGKSQGSILVFIVIIGGIVWLFDKISEYRLFILSLIISTFAYFLYLSQRKKNDKKRHLKSLPPLKPLKCELGDCTKNYKAKSLTTKTESYIVNLNDHSCTCPDFTDFRSSFEKGDLRRFCKHMIQVIIKTGIINNLAESVQLVFCSAYDRKKGIFLDEYKFTAVDESVALIGKSNNEEWFTVIAQEESKNSKFGGYKRFGYNINEGRWSYGENPLNSKIFKQLIENWDRDH